MKRDWLQNALLIRTMRKTGKLTKFTWLLSVLSVVAYCLLSFFFWSLIDLVTPFFETELWLPILLLALAALVFAIVLPFQRWKTEGRKTLLPLGFLVICFIAARFIDFTSLWLAANFKFRYTDRQEVVRRIADGEFRPNVSYNASLITLPKKFSAVSLGGGQVIVQRDGDKLKILFFTFRGILNSFAGFVYSSDDSVPKKDDFGGDFFVEKVQDKWYYVSSH